MNIKILLFLYAILATPSNVGAHSLTVDEQAIDFGEKYQFSVVASDVQVWNRSAGEISFHDATLPAGVTLKADSNSLAPGKSTILHLKCDLRNRLGTVSIPVPIETIEAFKTEHYQVLLSGYVSSILDNAKPSLDFGVVDAGAISAEKTIVFNSTDSPEFLISRVIEAPDFVDARIGEDHKTLFFKPKNFNVLGYSKGIVKVALDSKKQSEAWVTLLMDIHGNVVPDQNPINFGLQRPHTVHPIRLQLSSRDMKSFRIGKVSIDDSTHVIAEPVACLPKPRDDCRAFLVAIKPNHPHGMVFGKLSFELPDSRQTLNVNLGGVFLGDDTRVRSLNSPSNDAAEASQGQSQVPKKVDLSLSLKDAVVKAAETAPPGVGPLLKWDVANEAGIYGYAIFRSGSVEGHFVRANDAIVSADNGGDNTTATYQWRDTRAENGKEYWYYITIFYNDGRKQQLTGPQKVVAK